MRPTLGECSAQLRFGTAEAHGQAEMMEFNYLSEQGAIRRNPNGRYQVDYAKMPGAIAALAKELLEIEATGDRQRAENWFKKYGQMPEELNTALKAASDVPVDVDPVFEFEEKCSNFEKLEKVCSPRARSLQFLRPTPRAVSAE